VVSATAASSCMTVEPVRLHPRIDSHKQTLTPLILFVDLSGWQIDQKWDAALRAQKGGGGAAADASSSDSDEDIPFACLICRKPYTDPVVTRCGHYFCSACAIKRFGKTPKCLACGAPTNGIFNRADKVIDKMRKAKEAKGADGDDDGSGAENEVQVDGLGQASDEE